MHEQPFDMNERFQKFTFVLILCLGLNGKSSRRSLSYARVCLTQVISSIWLFASDRRRDGRLWFCRHRTRLDQTWEVKEQLSHWFATSTSSSDRKDKDTDTSAWNLCLSSRGRDFKSFTLFRSKSKEKWKLYKKNNENNKMMFSKSRMKGSRKKIKGWVVNQCKSNKEIKGYWIIMLVDDYGSS